MASGCDCFGASAKELVIRQRTSQSIRADTAGHILPGCLNVQQPSAVLTVFITSLPYCANSLMYQSLNGIIQLGRDSKMQYK